MQPAGASPLRLRARMVVDATGRQVAFARRQGARKVAADALVGAFVFFAADPARKIDHGHTLIEACAEGWWYSAALPADRRVVCFMTDADLLRAYGLHEPAAWHALAGQAPETVRRLQGARPLGPPAVRAAGSFVLDRVAGSRWLAVGDAASTFDPLSSRGIFKALQSGIRAARTIREALEGNEDATGDYERLVHSEYEQYLQVRETYYGQEARWPGHPFWARRQGRTRCPRRILTPEFASHARVRLKVAPRDVTALHPPYPGRQLPPTRALPPLGLRPPPSLDRHQSSPGESREDAPGSR